jgi:hypothetical protein
VEFPLRDTLRKTRHHFVEVDGLFFLPAGAEAFKRDNRNAEVRFFGDALPGGRPAACH